MGEHPPPASRTHPVPIYSLSQVAENAPTLKGDISQGFLVGGHSAGANFATVLAHMARDDPFFEGRQLTGQVLREPFVVYPESVPERSVSSSASHHIHPLT